MRFASLGSGSAGNAMIVEKKSTRLLLDCGFGSREALLRLGRLNIAPDSLTAILVTHEHDDHAGGAFRLANRLKTPVWLTHGTLAMVERFLPKHRRFDIHIINSHSSFEIGDMEIHPFPVPHDAREPVQFVFSDGLHKLGVLTDTGSSTPHVENMLSGCDALMLECNHDLEMLMSGPYPWPLKKRVSGRLGHLDNASAAVLLKKLDNRKLKHIVAAHLSATNNTPALARAALSSALDCHQEWIGIAEQDKGFDWLEVN